MGFRRDLIRCRLRAAQRQSNREDGTASRSIAGCADRATEQGNQPLHYEQAKAETTLTSMDYAAVLHQWVEYPGNQPRRDSGTVVAHFNNPLVVPGSTESATWPPLGVYFIAFSSRLPTICRTRALSRCAGTVAREPDLEMDALSLEQLPVIFTHRADDLVQVC